MSQENVEALRRLFSLVGDGENPEALYELLDPEVEMVISARDLEGAIWAMRLYVAISVGGLGRGRAGTSIPSA